MDAFWNYWNSLTPTFREGILVGILGGVAVAVVTGGFKLFGISLIAGVKRLFKRPPPPPQHLPPATQHEVLIKVEPSQPPAPPPLPPPTQPATEGAALSPEIPRPPAVNFVARRDKEGHDILTQLKERLAPHQNQLLVLWGPGGVGKTRLAIEAARALSESFAGRIAWVSADGRPDFNLSTLLDAIATQLKRPELRQLAPDPKAEQVRALLAAHPTLVVLDNFETVAPDEQTRCTDFLARHANCPALVTTRNFIPSDFVRNVSVDAMELDEAQKFLDELIAESPEREAFDAPTRERIIETATAIPLVMQWVVRQIILTQEPRDVLEKVSHGAGDAAQRVFDNSFNLPQLGEDGRAALLALSLFTPSASRPALAEVAGFGGDVERLNQAAKSLGSLRLVRTADGGRRLLIEGLTRNLAHARLSETAQADDFRRRFVAYFLRYAEAHAQPTPEDLDAQEAEKDNLLGAVDAAFEMKDWPGVMGIRIGLEYFLDLRGHWGEAISSGEQAVTAARSAKNDWNVAHFTACVANIRNYRGEYEGAGSAYREALDVFGRLEGVENVAACLHQLGLIAQLQGDLAEAQRLYGESLEISKKLGNQGDIAATLHQLGRLAQDQEDLAEARRLYGESLEIKKRIGDQKGIAITLHQLAMLAEDEGDIEEAWRLYGESLEIKKRIGNQGGIAATLHELGRLAKKEGDRAEAARLFREALGIYEKLGSPNAEIARRSLARVEGETPER